jgi:hypothetical protein
VQSKHTPPRHHASVRAIQASLVRLLLTGTLALFTVAAAQGQSVSSLTINLTSVRGGQDATGTVTLNSPAPAGGLAVALSSDVPTAATPTISANFAAGATTTTFPIATLVVPASVSVKITATLNNSSKTASLVVTPPPVISVTVSPSKIKGGTYPGPTGSLTISDPAPSGGLRIHMFTDNTDAAIVDDLTVPAGVRTVSFLVGASPVVEDVPVTISADIEGNLQTTTITVLAANILSLTLSATQVHDLSSCAGTVTLDAPSVMPSRLTPGTVVTFSSSKPNLVSVPANTTFPFNSKSTTFPITIGQVKSPTTVVITATLRGFTKTTTLLITPHIPSDIDSDGFNDLFLQNSQTGEIGIWFMDGLKVLDYGIVDAVPAPGWQLRAAVDFNDDGRADLLFQNATTGQLVIWYMISTHMYGGEAVALMPGAAYNVVGTGDFNSDGKPDLVFQNQNTHEIVIWFMDQAKVIGGDGVGVVPTAGYNVVGAGDFNADGKADIVFQNADTNQIVVWYMDGTVYTGGSRIAYTPLSAWKVKGIADYNDDGIPDIVFQNSDTNQVLTWFMKGLNVTGGDLISVQPPFPFQLVGPH